MGIWIRPSRTRSFLSRQGPEWVDIWAYSNCEEVEPFVNGKNMGRATMPPNGHLSWTAIYQPGKLEAIGYIGGRKVTSEHLETAGSAKNVKIDPHLS